MALRKREAYRPLGRLGNLSYQMIRIDLILPIEEIHERWDDRSHLGFEDVDFRSGSSHI